MKSIVAIEAALRLEDPEFAHRFTRIGRRGRLGEIAVFALLSVGAVLLVTGLATGVPSLVTAGIAFLIAAVGLNEATRRRC